MRCNSNLSSSVSLFLFPLHAASVSFNLLELRTSFDDGSDQQFRTDPLRHLRALEAACHKIAKDERREYEKWTDAQGKKIKFAILFDAWTAINCHVFVTLYPI